MNFASVDRGRFGGEVDLLMLFSLELFVVVHCLCCAGMLQRAGSSIRLGICGRHLEVDCCGRVLHADKVVCRLSFAGWPVRRADVRLTITWGDGRLM